MDFKSLNCPICYEEFDQIDRQPRVLPLCGHTLCSSCLSALLKSQNKARCPIDKQNFTVNQMTIQAFPINFALNQLVEDRQVKETCKVHREDLNLVCFTDSCKICIECALDETHMGHKIKPLKRIDVEATGKQREIENIVEELQKFQEELNQIIEGKRTAQIKAVRANFEEIRNMIYGHELDLLLEINAYFDQEKEGVNQAIGLTSNLRSQMTQNTLDLESILKNEEFLMNESFLIRVQDDISKWKSRIEPDKIQTNIESLKQSFGDIFQPFDINAIKQANFWPELKFPLADPLDNLTKVFFADDGAIDQWKSWTGLTSFKLQSSFRLKYNDKSLEIFTEALDCHDLVINLDSLKDIEEVKLNLSKRIFEQKDVYVLNYIWKRLQCKTLKLQLSSNSISESICQVLKEGLDSVIELEIDLENYKLYDSDQAVSLIENLLSSSRNLKKLSLVMNKVNLVNKNIESVFSNGIAGLVGLEELALSLDETNLSDQDLCNMFTPISLPNLTKFCLYLSETNVSDKGVELLAQNTLTAIKQLEDFTIGLYGTKVTDTGMIALFDTLPNIKKLDLDLGYTYITDQTVKLLASAIFTAFDSIEKFEVSFGGTRVTDEGLCCLFHTMPNVKSYFLSLFETSITDKTVESFVKNSFTSMEKLESFTLWLHNTDVSDSSIGLLLTDMKELKHLSLNFSSTKVTDESLEPFVMDKLPTILENLQELNVDVTDTQVSRDIKDEIANFVFKIL